MEDERIHDVLDERLVESLIKDDQNDSQGSSVLKPIKPPQKIHVIASQHIVTQIRAGVWPPGTRLPPERELSEMLGISRSSVRQALTTLESIGVLHSKRGVGHFVKEKALKSVNNEIVDSLVNLGGPQELLEARRIIEPEVSRLTALYRQSEDLMRLYKIIEIMEEREKDGDFSKYLEADFHFHLALAYATHNPVLIDIVEVIVKRMKSPPWLTATYTIVPNTLTSNRMEHLAILEAVSARKSKEARNAMIRHLASVAKNLRNISAFSDLIQNSEELSSKSGE